MLHWKVADAAGRRLDDDDAQVDLAIEKPGGTGWLAMGLPQVPGSMVGAHAIVASGIGTSFFDLANYFPSSFEAIDIGSLRVPIAGASSGVSTSASGARTVLQVSGARL